MNRKHRLAKRADAIQVANKKRAGGSKGFKGQADIAMGSNPKERVKRLLKNSKAGMEL